MRASSAPDSTFTGTPQIASTSRMNSVAVLRLADRRRGDDIELGHTHLARERGKTAKRGAGLLRRVGGEASRLRDAGAEAGEDLFVEERRRRAGETLVDDETDGIRPDVDDGDRAASGDAALRGQRLSRAGGARKHEARRISAIGRGPKGSDWS